MLNCHIDKLFCILTLTEEERLYCVFQFELYPRRFFFWNFGFFMMDVWNYSSITKYYFFDGFLTCSLQSKKICYTCNVKQQKFYETVFYMILSYTLVHIPVTFLALSQSVQCSVEGGSQGLTFLTHSAVTG